jgi:eukaryotic-like serine/threonine-protein kinase
MLAGMDEHVGPCVETDELVQMLAGELPVGRVDAILVHVDRCSACGEVIAELGKLDGPARTIGRYQLGRVLGAGAMGIVHEAWDPALQRNVALKLVHPERSDTSARERMLREARALARVSHPNVVAVHDVSEHGDDICIATELVDGETLHAWQAGRSVAEIVGAYVQAARGLAAAHAAGIVHRDVKPTNILIGRDGRVRVGDFGLARYEATAEPAQSAAVSGPIANSYMVGTPAYMAPEQLANAPEPRSDQFSLAVSLVEALTGNLHTRGDDPVFAAHPRLAPVVLRGIRQDPEERFPTMAAFADALAAAIAPPPRRRRGLFVAVAAAGAVAAGAIAFAMWPRTPSCDAPTVPASLWPDRRAALARVMTEPVAARVDAWLGAWSAASTDVCTVERDDATLRARRERCLGDLLAEKTDHIEGWTADTAYRPDVWDELEAVPPPARCSHDVQVYATDPTPRQLVAIEPLRAQLRAATRARVDLDLEPLAVAALAIGYAPLAVDIARAMVISGDRGSGAIARRALVLADAGPDLVAQIRARIAVLITLDQTAAGEASALADAARAPLAKLGNPADLAAELDYRFASVLTAKSPERAAEIFARAAGEFRAALGPNSLREAIMHVTLMSLYLDDQRDRAMLERDAAVAIFRANQISHPLADSVEHIASADASLRDYERAFRAVQQAAPDSIDVARAEQLFASALGAANRWDDALPHFEHVIALHEHLGLRNRDTVRMLWSAAFVLNQSHRFRDALAFASRGVQIADAIDDQRGLVDSLEQQGHAYVELSDLRAAREPLERANRLRDKLHETGAARGFTKFLLAIATWDTDPARALDLAVAARVDLQGDESRVDPWAAPTLTKTSRDRLENIRVWIDKHPLPARHR